MDQTLTLEDLVVSDRLTWHWGQGGGARVQGPIPHLGSWVALSKSLNTVGPKVFTVDKGMVAAAGVQANVGRD